MAFHWLTFTMDISCSTHVACRCCKRKWKLLLCCVLAVWPRHSTCMNIWGIPLVWWPQTGVAPLSRHGPHLMPLPRAKVSMVRYNSIRHVSDYVSILIWLLRRNYMYWLQFLLCISPVSQQTQTQVNIQCRGMPLSTHSLPWPSKEPFGTRGNQMQVWAC